MSTPTPPSIPVAPAPPGIPSNLKWPKVIGVISIVYAALCLLNIVIYVSTPYMHQFSFRSYLEENPGPNPVTELIDESFFMLWTQLPYLLIVCPLQIYAGILLLRQRRSGKTLHIVWALLVLTVGSVAMWLTRRYMELSFLAGMSTEIEMSDEEDMILAPMISVFRVFSYVYAVVMVLLNAIYPVFLLIWFRRDKVKQDLASSHFRDR